MFQSLVKSTFKASLPSYHCAFPLYNSVSPLLPLAAWLGTIQGPLDSTCSSHTEFAPHFSQLLRAFM